MNTITKRQAEVLKGLIQLYVNKAVPVGSHHLVKNNNLNCSTATIRKEMMNLEKKGFLKQPHTSAGRIPTTKGYRFYVDELMTIKFPNNNEKNKIHQAIKEARGDLNILLEQASKILGEISSELAVVLTPGMSEGTFDRMELIGLSEKKVLAVIHVRSRLVKTYVLEISSELKQKDLQRAASLINERLSGLSLEQIIKSIKKRMRDADLKNRELLDILLNTAPVLFNFSEPLDIHTCGTYNIINQPEFLNTDLLGQFFYLIDDRKKLIKLFNRKVEKTEITIGTENENERLKDFTVIKSNYQRGKDYGTLGVIGPTRLQYDTILPLIDCVTTTINHYLR
ncbi:MAG: heat-inducible transcriptional repressor HrcA [bacterium]